MLRLSRPGDEPALLALWQDAFGDPPEVVEAFWKVLYQPGDAMVWAEGDTIASAIYLLDAGTLTLKTGETVKVAYSYALATLSAHRGRGLGSAVARAAIGRSFDLGFSYNLIRPAEVALFPFYVQLGFTHTFPVAGGVLDCYRNITNDIMSTDFSTYLQLRRQLPPDTAVEYSPAFLRYVARCALDSGGGLYRLVLQGQTLCAIVERRDDTLLIREILPAPLAESGAKALLAHFEAKSAVFQTVPDPLGPAVSPFLLGAAAEGAPPPPGALYAPFVLD